jgi:hypothetical protein
VFAIDCCEPPPLPSALFKRDQALNSHTTSVTPVHGGDDAASGVTPQLGRTPMSVFRVVHACLESANVCRAGPLGDRSLSQKPFGEGMRVLLQEGQGPASFGGPNKKARPEVSLADAPGLFSSGSASA